MLEGRYRNGVEPGLKTVRSKRIRERQGDPKLETQQRNGRGSQGDGGRGR